MLGPEKLPWQVRCVLLVSLCLLTIYIGQFRTRLLQGLQFEVQTSWTNCTRPQEMGLCVCVRGGALENIAVSGQ